MATALIDADVIAYKSSVKIQDLFDDELIADPRKAFQEATLMIDQWMKAARCNRALLCFSPPSGSEKTFRYEIFPKYKANRNGKSKPLVYNETVAYLEKYYKVVRMPRLEGDDVLGIYGTSEKMDKPVLVSNDKDILTIPGHSLLVGKMTRPTKVTLQMADRAWMYQTLIGDSADGYKGCAGIGPKKADALLAEGNCLGQWWDIVRQAFEDKEQTDVTTMARLARILRREDWHPDTKEITLWHPTYPERMSVG